MEFGKSDDRDRTVLHTRVVTGSGGGPDKTILNSPRYLNGHGYRCICAFMHHPDDEGFGSIRQRAAEAEAPIVSVADRGPWDVGIVSRLVKLCREERVDIWHGHDYKSNLLGIIVRRFHPMKLVTTVHGWVRFTSRTPLYYWIDRRCLPRYDAVICVSEDLERACSEIGVRSDRLHLVHNAIDTERFRRVESVRDAKRRLGFDPERILIGAVGRLSPEKGFDLLIRVVDRLVREGENVELAIIGDGDHRASLEAQVRDLPDAGRVRLHGFRSDVRDCYQAMDVFALSSLREGLPNVVLEAMALEVPVAATRVAGMPGLIQDDQNGLLANPACETSLSSALQRLVKDSDLRRRLGAAGRVTVTERYSFARRMDSMREIYSDVMQR